MRTTSFFSALNFENVANFMFYLIRCVGVHSSKIIAPLKHFFFCQKENIYLRWTIWEMEGTMVEVVSIAFNYM